MIAAALIIGVIIVAVLTWLYSVMAEAKLLAMRETINVLRDIRNLQMEQVQLTRQAKGGAL